MGSSRVIEATSNILSTPYNYDQEYYLAQFLPSGDFKKASLRTVIYLEYAADVIYNITINPGELLYDRAGNVFEASYEIGFVTGNGNCSTNPITLTPPDGNTICSD